MCAEFTHLLQAIGSQVTSWATRGRLATAIAMAGTKSDHYDESLPQDFGNLSALMAPRLLPTHYFCRG